ncbi:MAG: hypothetical protein ACYDH0_12055 [Candidatus Aminicenantales bacterium]
MKKIFLSALILLFAINLFPADFTFTQLSKGKAGNNRFPGIGENDKGERLAVWRSGTNSGMLFTYFKDGAWSSAAPIPSQRKTSGEFLGSDIVADSQNRFHVVWELMDDAAYYASFKDGVWTNPVEIPFPAVYEGFQISLDIRSNTAKDLRSNEELVVVATCIYGGIYKDITIGYLQQGESNFSRFKNLTDDEESSSSPAVAVDANDHLWIAYKGEVFGKGEEILETCLIHLDQNNNLVDFTEVNREQEGWAFLQWAAANKITDTIMTVWWKDNGFYSKWYDQTTKTWSPIRSIGIGQGRQPDFSMWSKVIAQGKDFYFIGKNGSHIPFLVKFNGETKDWEKPIQIYDKPTVYFDLFPGYENVDIVFCTRDEPAQVYFTTFGGTPQILIKSPVNVQVEAKVERSFFRGLWINHVTWENNPFNIGRNITIDHYNLYRKLKTENSYASTPYQSNIPSNQLYFNDKDGIVATQLYDYAVTCVATINGKSVESKITY